MSAKIVYGDYTITNKIGTVVGYSTESDLKISEIGEIEEHTFGGETKQIIYSNHGLSATGTLVLTDSQTGSMKGKVIQITDRTGNTRPYAVDEWEVGLDEETGATIATFTATSRDSMVNDLNIGPRDPETGAPLSGKVKFVLGLDFEDYGVDAAEWQGKTIGLFPESAWNENALWDFSKAVYTAPLNGVQAEFIVDGNAEGLIFGGNNGNKKLHDEEGNTNLFGTQLYVFRNAVQDTIESSDSASA